MIPPHYVLTGGPCAGKTTTILELEKRGYPVLAEAARLIIDEHLAAGKKIEEIVGDSDWLPSVVRRKLAMEKAVPESETYFFDRGVPDSIAYYRTFNVPKDETLKNAVAESKYAKIFLLDLVDFKNDEARHEDPEEAKRLHGFIRDAYQGLGYELVHVPVMPVDERVDFILAHL